MSKNVSCYFFANLTILTTIWGLKCQFWTKNVPPWTDLPELTFVEFLQTYKYLKNIGWFLKLFHFQVLWLNSRLSFTIMFDDGNRFWCLSHPPCWISRANYFRTTIKKPKKFSSSLMLPTLEGKNIRKKNYFWGLPLCWKTYVFRVVRQCLPAVWSFWAKMVTKG